MAPNTQATAQLNLPDDLPTLQEGTSSFAVGLLQRLLISEGYGPNLPVTGYFGDETAAAVENFQQAAGLAQDGVVGPDTWQALIVLTVAN